ncbi:MAG: efflux transporter periplasmic adaptor subunit [Verrucomicrobiales bacterium]|nr:efflux transporter periplasmic adaptor subunit [Verrucomicrobiales bacterium]
MKIFRFIIPFVILGLCGHQAKRWIDPKEPPRRFSAPPTHTHVKAARITPTSYTVSVASQGTVRPRTEGTLNPQVTGVVVEVSPNFRDGGFFEKGEVLLRIDKRDYENALTIAQATLTDAESSFEEEKALAEQAAEDWKRLGRKGKPNALALRKPQLAKASSNVVSAKARVERAQRDLDRTEIRAPYAGRILDQSVDVGRLVTPGTVLASIYAVDYAEIRLPLSNQQLAHVDVPEAYRGENVSRAQSEPEVELTTRLGQQEFIWHGRIVRAEGAVDTRSRQLFVVAQVDDPYGRKDTGQPPLKVGMFVRAKIQGKTMERAFVIPRESVRHDGEILLIDPENKLSRHAVEVAWRDSKNVVVTGGVKPGSLLCLTSLPFAVNGASVIPDIEGEGVRMLESQKPRGQGGPGGKKGGKGKGKRPPGGEQ